MIQDSKRGRPLPKARRIAQAQPVTQPEAPAPPKAPPKAPAARPAPGETGIQINTSEEASSVTASYAAKRGGNRLLPFAIAGGLGFCAVFLMFLFMGGSSPTLALGKLVDQNVNEMTTLTYDVPLKNAGSWNGNVRFELIEGPPKAELHEGEGTFRWQPLESHGPGTYDVKFRVVSRDDPTVAAEGDFRVIVGEVNQPPAMADVEEQTVRQGDVLTFNVGASDPDSPSNPFRYLLTQDIPPGAQIDPESGAFTWNTAEAPEPGDYKVVVRVEETVRGGLSSERTIHVRVEPGEPVVSPVAGLVEKLRAEGLEVDEQEFPRVVAAGGYDFAGTPTVLTVNDQPLRVFAYDDEPSLAAELQRLETAAEEILSRGEESNALPQLYRADGLIAVYEGRDPRLEAALKGTLGMPIAGRGVAPPGDPVASTTPTQPEPPDLGGTMPETGGEPALDEGDATIRELYQKKRLFSKQQYPVLRKIYAGRFARRHEAEIQEAFSEEQLAWLDEHPEIREELYTAIVPAWDNVPKALQLFAELQAGFPDQFEDHFHAAIAVAVTWDNPRGVYDYSRHQTRCKAEMPQELIGAVDNFEYLLGTDSGQFLPWEFLIYVVNHKTPLEERHWAVTAYLPRRSMIGRCYHDVPYDNEMLKTKSEIAALNDKVYNLPNLRQFGGVCAMQADYASRVGKSLGIPAAYVRGESSFGEYHAWVMWVELKNVTSRQIAFSLESHGRYRGDKYYVGDLLHPQSGKRITDRQMELDLQTIGLDTEAARHADLVMKSYPMLLQTEELDVRDQINYLNEVTKLCPGNTSAWMSLAALSRDGKLEREHIRSFKNTIDRMFVTFKNVPDFTWVVFEDMIAFEDELKTRINYFEKLVGLYVSAGRPDLASRAQLKLAEMMIEDERPIDAAKNLVVTIQAFADDGRYVPPLIDRLEEIVRPLEGGLEFMDGFWASFLPRVPKKRGDRVSKHCQEMYDRAIKYFKGRMKPEIVSQLQAQRNQLK